MKLLTIKKQKSYENEKICHIYKKQIEDKHAEDEKYHKVRGHCCYTRKYRGAVHSICNLKYSKPKKSPIVFHNGSNYDYDFAIKGSAEKSEGQFTCLEENIKKYTTFPIPIEKKVTRIDKKEK